MKNFLTTGCLIFLFACCCSIAKAGDGIFKNSIKPISELLNADGSLNTASGFSGNLDLNGYKVVMSETGAPLFVKIESDEQQNKNTAWSSSSIAANELWDSRFSPVGFSNSPECALVDPSNNLYIAGYFTNFGNIKVNSIVKWDGTTWSALGEGLKAQNGISGMGPGTVYALAYYNNKIYAGGVFSKAGNVDAVSLAAWDGSNWSMPENWGGGAVYALHTLNNVLYIGGEFSAYRSIAKLQGNELDTVGKGLTGINNLVRRVLALTSLNGELYAGGNFLFSGDAQVKGLAKFNGTGWESIGSTSDFTYVNSLVSFQGRLIAGGGILPFSLNTIASYNPSNGDWSALPNMNFNINAFRMSVIDNYLYVNGTFTNSDGKNYSVKFDGTNWTPVSSLNGFPRAVVKVNGKIILAGDFTKSGTTLLNYAAIYDPVSSSVTPLADVSSGGKGLNRYPSASSGFNIFCVAGNDVYMGGLFTGAGNKVVNCVARWDGNNWNELGSGAETGVSFQGNSSTLPVIKAIVVSDSKVYIGGSFNRAGTTEANCIAMWDGINWHALGSGVSHNIETPTVTTMELVGTNLYVAGRFNSAGGTSNVGNIARWDGTAWHKVGNGFRGDVHCIKYNNGELYAGGAFGSELVTNRELNSIAKWNGTQWSVLGTAQNHGVEGSAAGTYVNAIEFLSNDSVLVGGYFFIAGAGVDSLEVDAPFLALYRPSTQKWSMMGDFPFEGNIICMQQSKNKIYIGGQFSSAGLTDAGFITYYDKATGQFHKLPGSGVNYIVSGMAKQQKGDSSLIYIGGLFTTAGNKPANYITILKEDLLTDVNNLSSNTPESFNLHQNYPNPFNPSTNIKFDIKTAGSVKLVIYNAAGERIAELLNSKLNSGSYNIKFDGRNLSSGVYFYSLITNNQVYTKKMLLVK